MFVLWFALKEGRAGICDPPPRPDSALRPVSAAQRSPGAEKHSRRTGFPQRTRRALLGPIDIQVIPACKRRLSALPVLTYLYVYAALRFSKNAIIRSPPSSRRRPG